MTICFCCFDSSSVSESSTKVSRLPYVTDPQPQDGVQVILFDRHLHLVVVRAGFATTSRKLSGQVLTAKALVSIDCCSGQAPTHKFRDPCVPETELWHSSIQLSDNGLDLRYVELQCIRCRRNTVCVFFFGQKMLCLL